VAFQAHDAEFMSHEMLVVYMEHVWLGRHFMALTDSSDERSFSYRNPIILARLVGIVI